MDLRQFYKEFVFVVILLTLQHACSSDYEDEEDPSFWSRCPQSIRNKLKNGRVKIRSRGRIAKFICDPGFELVGKRFATCVRNHWNNPLPVCVARGCHKMHEPTNGRTTEMYRGALLMFDCLPGYVIEGANTVFCDGRRWSTQAPTCKVATNNPKQDCDFEDPDLCGWSHDPTHDFDWKRNQFGTPSGHVGTGPSYDHTFGKGKGGFYLYEEASSPRKENDKSRLFSPVFPLQYSGGCFIFWYHMYGATTGGLNVYIKPETHVFDEMSPIWQKFGDQGNQWLKGNITVPALSENFQIIFEGVRGSGYVGDTAIDDVSITPIYSCESIDDGNETTKVEVPEPDSCRGRCREEEDPGYCGCNDHCYFADNCCSDYRKLCTTGNVTADLDHPDEFSSPQETNPITTAYVPAETSKRLLSTSFRANSETESLDQFSTAASQKPITPTIGVNAELTTQSKSLMDETTSTSVLLPTFHHITLPVTEEELFSKEVMTSKRSTEMSTLKSILIENTTKLANTITTEKKSTLIPQTTTRIVAKETALHSESLLSSITSELPSTELTAASAKQPAMSTNEQLATSATRQSSPSTSVQYSPSNTNATLSSTTMQATASNTKRDRQAILITSESTRLTYTPPKLPESAPTISSKYTTKQPNLSTTKHELTSIRIQSTESTRQSTTASTAKLESITPSTRQSTTASTAKLQTITPSTGQSTTASTAELELITPSTSPSSSTKSTTQTPIITPTSTESTSAFNPTYVSTISGNPYPPFSSMLTTTRRYNFRTRTYTLRLRTRTYSFTTASTRRDRFPNPTGYVSSVSPTYRLPLTFHTTRPVRPIGSTRSRTTNLQSTESTSINPSSSQNEPSEIITSYQFTRAWTLPNATNYQIGEKHPEHQGHSSSSLSEANVERSSSIVGVSVAVVLLSVMAGAIAYVMHKRRHRQHSKTSDYSEMRFLADNDVIEYSDASALDRILVK